MGFADRRLCQAVPGWPCTLALLSLLGCTQDMDPSPGNDAAIPSDAASGTDAPPADASPLLPDASLPDAAPPPDADGDAGIDAGFDAGIDAAPDGSI